MLNALWDLQLNRDEENYNVAGFERWTPGTESNGSTSRATRCLSLRQGTWTVILVSGFRQKIGVSPASEDLDEDEMDLVSFVSSSVTCNVGNMFFCRTGLPLARTRSV